MLDIITKYIVTFFWVTLGLYLFGQSVNWLQGQPLGSLMEELKVFGIYFLYSTFIGISNITTVSQLDKYISWDLHPKKRAIYGIIGAIVVSMISIFIVRFIIVIIIHQKDWNYFIDNENKVNYLVSLTMALVVVLGFYSYYFFKEISKKAIKEHEVVAKTESAKFESLKSQIDPHFLFNSLNVLTSLIGENPKKAEQFTTKLSQVYRYVLEQKDKDLVELEEELRFAKTYMDLLKMRFEDAVNYTLPEKISNPNYKIVPLSLQLVLENAVKHNSISEESPLDINIFEENGVLIIENNLNAKNTITTGTGVGLKNIIERYNLITDKKLMIEKNNNNFQITLPLLTKKTHKMDAQNFDENNRYIQARKRVEKMKEFYSNLTAYVIIIPLLAFINYKTYWQFKWFYFPMIGWGIGILFHFMDAFGYNFFIGKNWEERKIREFMEDDKEKWV